jgi:hypothetical protein
LRAANPAAFWAIADVAGEGRGRQPVILNGHRSDRNLAPQRGADVMLANAICCPEVGWGNKCNSID